MTGKLNCPQFVFIIELCLLFACNYCYHAYPKWSLFIIVLQLSEREIFLKRKGKMFLVLLLKEQVPIFGQMKSPFTNVYCVFASFIYSVGNHIPHSSGVATWHLYDDRNISISLSSHTLAQICFKRLPLTTFLFPFIHSFNKYTLRISFVLSTILNTWDKTVTETAKFLYLWALEDNAGNNQL